MWNSKVGQVNLPTLLGGTPPKPPFLKFLFVVKLKVGQLRPFALLRTNFNSKVGFCVYGGAFRPIGCRKQLLGLWSVSPAG
jgi:hypothetical protein